MSMRIENGTRTTIDRIGVRLCNVFRIQRRDGFVLRFTTADRNLIFESETYTPASFGKAGSERREAGMKESSGQITSFISTAAIQVPDMLAGLYKGAEVKHRIIDWMYPNKPAYFRSTKWVRETSTDSGVTVITLAGVEQFAQLESGGRFGGVYDSICPYALGDKNCKKDISGLIKTGVTVSNVVDDHMIADFSTASWTGTPGDDDFREGEIEWTSGLNDGFISPVLYFLATGGASGARRCEFFWPTPFPIGVGDVGIARPGCDGTLTTCDVRFSNAVNHGAWENEPDGSNVLAPANG